MNFVLFKLGDSDYSTAFSQLAEYSSLEIDLLNTDICELKDYAIARIVGTMLISNSNRLNLSKNKTQSINSYLSTDVEKMSTYLNKNLSVMKVAKLVELDCDGGSCYVDLATGKGYLA